MLLLLSSIYEQCYLHRWWWLSSAASLSISFDSRALKLIQIHTHTPKHAYTTLTFGLFSHISIPSFFVRCARVLSLSHSLVKYSRLKCFIRFGEFFFRFILLPSLFLRLFSRYTRQYFLRLGWMDECVCESES